MLDYLLLEYWHLRVSWALKRHYWCNKSRISAATYLRNCWLTKSRVKAMLRCGLLEPGDTYVSEFPHNKGKIVVNASWVAAFTKKVIKQC